MRVVYFVRFELAVN